LDFLPCPEQISPPSIRAVLFRFVFKSTHHNKKIIHLTTRGDWVICGGMKSTPCEQADEPIASSGIRTAYEDGIPAASIEVYGDKWCVFGNDNVSNLMDDALFFSKRNVFGFALME
jgi:hypothetical protein